MGLLDSFLKNPDAIGDVSNLATQNPQIANAVKSLFSSDSDPVCGSGGLGGIGDAIKGLMQSG